MLNLQSLYFGQKHHSFTYEDFKLIRKISRLAKKHHRQAENSCNGSGIVRGQVYYSGMSYGQIPGDYGKREYGYNVKSAYTRKDSEDCIFDDEMNKIENQINLLIKNRMQEIRRYSKYKVEYQGDPRGNTVKLYYENDFINL